MSYLKSKKNLQESYNGDTFYGKCTQRFMLMILIMSVVCMHVHAIGESKFNYKLQNLRESYQQNGNYKKVYLIDGLYSISYLYFGLEENDFVLEQNILTQAKTTIEKVLDVTEEIINDERFSNILPEDSEVKHNLLKFNDNYFYVRPSESKDILKFLFNPTNKSFQDIKTRLDIVYDNNDAKQYILEDIIANIKDFEILITVTNSLMDAEMKRKAMKISKENSAFDEKQAKYLKLVFPKLNELIIQRYYDTLNIGSKLNDNICKNVKEVTKSVQDLKMLVQKYTPISLKSLEIEEILNNLDQINKDLVKRMFFVKYILATEEQQKLTIGTMINTYRYDEFDTLLALTRIIIDIGSIKNPDGETLQNFRNRIFHAYAEQSFEKMDHLIRENDSSADVKEKTRFIKLRRKRQNELNKLKYRYISVRNHTKDVKNRLFEEYFAQPIEEDSND